MEKKKTPRINIEVTPELHAEIKHRAFDRNITVTVWVTRAIMEQIKKEQQYE